MQKISFDLGANCQEPSLCSCKHYVTSISYTTAEDGIFYQTMFVQYK